MAQTIPRVVNRRVIDTEDTFEDVRQRYESPVLTIDFAELAEVAGMPVIRLSGHLRRAITYMMANNVIAETMLR